MKILKIETRKKLKTNNLFLNINKSYQKISEKIENVNVLKKHAENLKR